MENLWTPLKAVLGIIVMFVGVRFWINGLTGWGDHGQIKKLWTVSCMVSIILVALFYMTFS